MRIPKIIYMLVMLALLVSCGGAPDGQQTASPQPTTVEADTTRETPAAASPAPEESPSPSPTATEESTQSPQATPDATEAPAASPQTTTEPTETIEPSETETAGAEDRTITITAPEGGTAITSPVTVNGEANYWPFEANLTGQVKDAAGNILGVAPLTVQSPGPPDGGPFEGQIEFDAPLTEQDGTIEVFEASAKDGTIVAIATVPVRLPASDEAGLQLDAPTFGQDVTLPLHIALRTRPAGDQLTARLVYSNDTVLEADIPIVEGSDGIGYGVLNLQWNTESAPPPTEPGAATLQIVGADGAVRKEVTVNVLPDDATQLVDVAWVAGEEIIEFQQRVPRTEAIGTAALNELLNGPPTGNLAGAETALPTVEEIVTFPGREADWGYRVRLLGLTIEDGVATANFSPELRAYGGGSARVQLIRQQIEQTLTQFPTVERVEIQIDGESEGVLEP